jgi:hypothetical protein
MCTHTHSSSRSPQLTLPACHRPVRGYGCPTRCVSLRWPCPALGHGFHARETAWFPASMNGHTHTLPVALLAETSRHPLASVTAPSRNVATWRVLSEFCEAVRVVVLTTILSDNRSSINVNGSQPWSCGTAKSDTLRPKRLPIHIRVGSAGERSRPPVQSFFVQLPHEPNRTEPN